MDIDLFGNIDNFLQATCNLEYKNNSQDDSSVLNENSPLSVPVVTKNVSKRRKKTTVTTTSTKMFTEDDNEFDFLTNNKSVAASTTKVTQQTKFQAGKGQKLAVKRFEKIRENLEKNVKQAELNDSLVEINTIPINVPRRKKAANTTSTITTRPSRRTRIPQNTMGTIDLTDEIPLFRGSTIVSPAGPSKMNTSITDLDAAFNSENYNLTIKINWYTQILKINLRKYQKFSDLCQILGEIKEIDPATIVLMMNDVIINTATETPDSIGYTIGKFISARSAQNIDISTLTSSSAQNAAGGKNNELKIKLKIQCVNRKKPIFVTIKRSNKMKVLVIKLSEELNIPPNKLRLKFDGEPLDLESTPDDLDIDDDELLDLKIIE